jgi:hypothetical protein
MQKRITVLLDDQEKAIPGQMGCERYLATNNQDIDISIFSALGFELSASYLLGRHSYCLSHSASPKILTFLKARQTYGTEPSISSSQIYTSFKFFPA